MPAVSLRNFARPADDGTFNTTSKANAVPTGTAVGDLLIAIIHYTRETAAVQALPSQFTRVSTGPRSGETSASAAGLSQVAYRIVASGDPTSYTFVNTATNGSYESCLYSFYNFDPAAPISVGPTWSNVASGTVPAPSVTIPAGDDGAALLCMFGVVYGSATPTISNPTGMTRDFQERQGNYGNMAVSRLMNVAAGATGAKSATVSAYSGTNQSMTVAINPLPDPVVARGDFLPFFQGM